MSCWMSYGIVNNPRLLQMTSTWLSGKALQPCTRLSRLRASPRAIWVVGKRCRSRSCKTGFISTASRFSGRTPCFNSASVIAPVPAPNSTTRCGEFFGMAVAIIRPSWRPDGATEATRIGFFNHCFRKIRKVECRALRPWMCLCILSLSWPDHCRVVTIREIKPVEALSMVD